MHAPCLMCDAPPRQGLPLPGIRIKWPNDIYTAGGLKIGGALIHTTWQRDRCGGRVPRGGW